MLSLIDAEPLQPGYGRIYQSGALAALEWDQPGLVVSMSGNENFEGPCLWVNFRDDDETILPINELLTFSDLILDWLAMGQDVLIHCNEGKYRSTYMDIAAHMRAGMPFDAAFALVKKRHPIADLRNGTRNQLERQGPTSKEVV